MNLNVMVVVVRKCFKVKFFWQEGAKKARKGNPIM